MKDSNSGLNLSWTSEGSNGNCKRRAGVMEVIETVLTDVPGLNQLWGEGKKQFV